jgi:hypothetical protein
MRIGDVIGRNTTSLGLLDLEDAGTVGLRNVKKYSVTRSHDPKELNRHNL